MRLLFVNAVHFFQVFQFVDERFVLRFEHLDAVFEALDVLFLLAAAFARGLAVFEQSHFSLSRRLLHHRYRTAYHVGIVSHIRVVVHVGL